MGCREHHKTFTTRPGPIGAQRGGDSLSGWKALVEHAVVLLREAGIDDEDPRRTASAVDPEAEQVVHPRRTEHRDDDAGIFPRVEERAHRQ